MSAVFDKMTVGRIRQKARDAAATTVLLYWLDGLLPVQPINIARAAGAQVFSAQLDDDKVSVECRSNSAAGTADEIYANEFAASLLMPEDAVREHVAQDSDVLRMARAFGVSVSAMQWRLRHLRLTGLAA